MRRATSKCLAVGDRRSFPQVGRRIREHARIVWVILLAIGWGICSQAQVQPEEPVVRASKAHADSKARAEASPDNVQYAWELGRACFDLAEFATNNTQRASLARQGIATCEHALSLTATSAPARYYLGMNRGQLARTSTLGALKLVDQMERDFLAARKLEPAFDEAGPDRNLGLLYLQAPGWPVSVGNRSKARVHLEQAAALAPSYPENLLNLMEALARWGEFNTLQNEFETWTLRKPEAVQRFSGERWYRDWQQWEHRLGLLRRHVPELTSSARTQSD